ncbi:Hypothetical protein FKW44_012850 [Caligus rogercresseyi]|uniref:Uncharacterized protein n=1 Tax=Caligus rogercresseyi TaxID=217165 RepID=A0A7T8K9U5_CALRO|nr:Hypothetical protein FKW44_012850 [Caligus rogercresseyi]
MITRSNELQPHQCDGRAQVDLNDIALVLLGVQSSYIRGRLTFSTEQESPQ